MQVEALDLIEIHPADKSQFYNDSLSKRDCDGVMQY